MSDVNVSPNMKMEAFNLLTKIIEAAKKPDGDIWSLGRETEAALLDAWERGRSSVRIPQGPAVKVREERKPLPDTESPKPERTSGDFQIPSDDWLLYSWPKTNYKAGHMIRAAISAQRNFSAAGLLILRNRVYGKPSCEAEDIITREKLAAILRHTKGSVIEERGEEVWKRIETASKLCDMNGHSMKYQRLLSAKKAAERRGRDKEIGDTDV